MVGRNENSNKVLSDIDINQLFCRIAGDYKLSEDEIKTTLGKIIFNLIKDVSDNELELKTRYFSDDLRDASENPKHFSLESLLSITEDLSKVSKLK